MRINWDKVPKYMITIKPVFGNLGKVIAQRNNGNGTNIYRLQQIVGNRNLCFEFYDYELTVAKED